MSAATSNESIIAQAVSRATVELFAAYRHPVAPRSEPVALGEEDDVAFAAVIGFTGPEMRGTLTLAPTRALAMPAAPEGVALERDWVGELANQLLGRIKNHLLQYGVELYVTTPAVIRGQQLAAVPRGELLPYVFDAIRGRVWVYFDPELRDGLVLAPCAAALLSEGETILF